MIAEQFDVFLLDLDGVVYLGDEALPNAADALARLREMEKELRFLTNDPRPMRTSVIENLREMGIEAQEDEIVTAGWATARYLSDRGVTSVAVVGSTGLEIELEREGIAVTDDDPEAMVVGADEKTSYLDIQRAARHIDNGATFVGTNPDGAFPTPAGPAPGAGAIVRAVEEAAGTTPTVVGKPEPLMFEMALRGLPQTTKTAVIGDNPATDILGAHRAGLTGILVAKEEPEERSGRDFRDPETTISTLADLFRYNTETWGTPQYQWPEEISPGVGAIILNDPGEVLLLKRADWEQWALPTGTVERCESVREATIREVMEETGLKVTVDRLTGVYSSPEKQVFPYPFGRAVHFITNCFRCSIIGGTLEPDGDEAIDVEFFEVDDLPTSILAMHPGWIADATTGEGSVSVR